MRAKRKEGSRIKGDEGRTVLGSNVFFGEMEKALEDGKSTERGPDEDDWSRPLDSGKEDFG
jgi:hypothetical protein